MGELKGGYELSDLTEGTTTDVPEYRFDLEMFEDFKSRLLLCEKDTAQIFTDYIRWKFPDRVLVNGQRVSVQHNKDAFGVSDCIDQYESMLLSKPVYDIDYMLIFGGEKPEGFEPFIFEVKGDAENEKDVRD